MSKVFVILYDPARDLGGRCLQAQIMDIAPTVLKFMGEPIPADMQGKVIETTNESVR